MQLRSQHKHFGGYTEFYEHESRVNKAPMRFAVFQPPQISKAPVPVLYWLSGLTCTEENFMVKAGAQQHAAEHGLMLVCMDTSPRNLGLAGEDDSYDFGAGAGFYLNATEAPWSAHYHMHDYVVQELPELIQAHFNVDAARRGVFGHSMGGHGALSLALRNPGVYRSVSAFAPIVAPSECPWGEKAFTGYLGADRTAWRAYDSCALIADARERLPLLVDQGEADEFLHDQLMPEKLQTACAQAGHPLQLRMQPGYDHSYYFIASFMADHLRHHATALKA